MNWMCFITIPPNYGIIYAWQVKVVKSWIFVISKILKVLERVGGVWAVQLPWCEFLGRTGRRKSPGTRSSMNPVASSTGWSSLARSLINLHSCAVHPWYLHRLSWKVLASDGLAVYIVSTLKTCKALHWKLLWKCTVKIRYLQQKRVVRSFNRKLCNWGTLHLACMSQEKAITHWIFLQLKIHIGSANTSKHLIVFYLNNLSG